MDSITRWIVYQTKSNEKYMSFLHYISSFEGTSYKNLKDRATNQIFYLLLYLLPFTSADIIFYKSLEHHSILSEKKIFLTNYSFLTDSLKPPNPLTAEIR